MAIDGVIGQVDLEVNHAADGRHGPVIKTVQLKENIGVLKAGELLFAGSGGAASAKDATQIQGTKTQAADGVLTEFDIDLGKAILPGSVSVKTDDSTPKELADDGDGTLSGDDGEGTVDYANGKVHVEFTAAPAFSKTVTVKAVPASGFIGVLDDDIEAGEAAANAVVHGTIYEGVAKLDGVAATPEQLEFLKDKGIY
ncbi:MAG: hypothetical protein IJQ27_04210 [Spirochaetia bacterium]|nr:hypothetical protein [Spirochaetia bacterium]